MDIPDVTVRLDALLDAHTPALVAAYFDPASRFTGATFDLLPPNDPNTFCASDILAASLLDVPFEPRAVRALLTPGDDVYPALLEPIPVDVDLWDATDTQLAAGLQLWRQVRTLHGVGPTRASKLLARKRPRLFPVMDTVLRDGLTLAESDDSWAVLRAAYNADDRALVGRVNALRPPGLSAAVSTLRVLDAALWMHLSRSVHVRKVRDRLPAPAAVVG